MEISRGYRQLPPFERKAPSICAIFTYVAREFWNAIWSSFWDWVVSKRRESEENWSKVKLSVRLRVTLDKYKHININFYAEMKRNSFIQSFSSSSNSKIFVQIFIKPHILRESRGSIFSVTLTKVFSFFIASIVFLNSVILFIYETNKYFNLSSTELFNYSRNKKIVRPFAPRVARQDSSRIKSRIFHYVAEWKSRSENKKDKNVDTRDSKN